MPKALRPWDYALLLPACALYAVAYNWCFAPNDITFGGFTGVAQILHHWFPALAVGQLTIVLNVPLFALGLWKLGKGALLSSLAAMAVSALVLDAVGQRWQFSTMEPLMACLYGGALLGLSVGLLLRMNTTTGGSELLARLLKLPFPHLSIGRLCLLVDGVVVCVYGLVFGGLDNCLYSMVALYICSQVTDYVIYGTQAARVAYIISREADILTAALLELGRGVTLLQGAGGYTGTEKQVIFCAIKRSQIVPVKRLIRELDPNAFVIVCPAAEVLGEGFGENTPHGL